MNPFYDASFRVTQSNSDSRFGLLLPTKNAVEITIEDFTILIPIDHISKQLIRVARLLEYKDQAGLGSIFLIILKRRRQIGWFRSKR